MENLWTHYSADQRKQFFQTHETDCKFLVGLEEKEIPIEIKSYKFILTSISPVFERILNGDIKSNEAILINDISGETFNHFLEMAYHRETKRKGFNWKGVYFVAKKYLAETVIGFVICELGHYIICNPNPIDNLHFFEIVEMEDKPSLFCPSMVNPINKAFKMHCFQIYRLKRKVFQSLCAVVKKIDPLVRFRVLENYCALNNIARTKAEISEDNLFIDSCLELINFDALSLNEFTDFVDSSKLLTLREKYDILLKISEKLAFDMRML